MVIVLPGPRVIATKYSWTAAEIRNDSSMADSLLYPQTPRKSLYRYAWIQSPTTFGRRAYSALAHLATTASGPGLTLFHRL